jgi:hypothetical protein
MPLRRPSSAATSGTSSAICRALGRAFVLMWMISAFTSAGWSTAMCVKTSESDTSMIAPAKASPNEPPAELTPAASLTRSSSIGERCSREDRRDRHPRRPGPPRPARPDDPRQLTSANWRTPGRGWGVDSSRHASDIGASGKHRPATIGHLDYPFRPPNCARDGAESVQPGTVPSAENRSRPRFLSGRILELHYRTGSEQRG